VNNKGSAEWLMVIRKRWKFLLISFFIPAIIAFVISLFLPKMYQSTAEILSPEIRNGSSIIQTPLGAITKGGNLGGTISSSMIITLLNSNYVIDRLNKKFDIMDKFNLKDKTSTREYLKDRILTIAYNEKRGVIQISVKSRYNNLNYKMANYCITLIDSANNYLKLTTQSDFIKVLNYAEPATIPCGPRKKLNALLGGFIGIIFALIYIYFKDNLTLSDES